MIFKIKKRTGEIVEFDPEKITTAIFKAAQAVGGDNRSIAEYLSGLVQDYLYMKNEDIVDVENIQDIIEKVLIEEGHAKTAKSFILYRQKRKEIRKAKSFTGIVDDCKLSLNAIKILQGRYLLKDSSGKIIETPKQLFQRVANHISSADEKFNENSEISKKQFFKLLSNQNFLPSSAILMNAGTNKGSLASVISLPIKDSTESIFTTLKNAAISHKNGIGAGFSFSNIRPRGDVVNNNFRAASGPISFLKIYDQALSEIKQSGKRSGANMAILNINHPDILDFITCKERRDLITNFNLSVGITDSFMEAVKNGNEHNLINPRTGEIVGQLNAKRTFDLIATMAWKNADPGVVFLDRFNNVRSNPTPHLGKIESTSPCGEQALLPNEAAVFGSINLSNHVPKNNENKQYQIDWEKLKITIHQAVHFLDNAIELSNLPLNESRKLILSNRKIGLGIMGFADLLIKLRTPYNSNKAIEIAEALIKFINNETREASRILAKRRGVFPNFYQSIYDSENEYYQVRNASRTTISPTGTISLIASCSQSIEPLYALSYLRKTSQFEMLEVNPLFEEIAKEEGFYSEDLLREISVQGSIQSIDLIPKHIKKIFITAMDLTPEDHIKMQSTFQKHIDNAVSKTVNFPYYSTVEDVREAFLLAYDLGCKGITIYRDGSHEAQVLNTAHRTFKAKKKDKNKSIIDGNQNNNNQNKKEISTNNIIKDDGLSHPHIGRTSHLYD